MNLQTVILALQAHEFIPGLLGSVIPAISIKDPDLVSGFFMGL